MAKRHIDRYYVPIRQEGENGATRGKIPAAMVAAMGAKHGGMIEFEIVNGDCIGGRSLNKNEVREIEREKKDAAKASKASKTTSSPRKPAAKASSSKTKPTVKAKSNKRVVETGWDTDEPKPKKKAGKAAKRSTKVSYESQPRKKKKGQVKLKKGR